MAYTLSPRIKITLTYTAVVMAVSFVFSALIYSSVSHQLELGFRRAQMRLEHQDQSFMQRYRQRQMMNNPEPLPLLIFNEDLSQAKQNVLANLIGINLVIVAISSAVSYWLAGISLRPLLKSIEQQKQFVSDASHELRTPITALRTNLEVNLDDPKIKGKSKQVLKQNLQQVTQLQNLIEHLLDLNRSQTIAHPIPDTSILATYQSAIQPLIPLAQKKKVGIKHTIPQAATVKMHPPDLQQVFTIFIDNAIKFSQPNATIKITANSLSRSTEITISDSGVGIDDQQLPYIFDRFYQADSARTSQTGHGLGLAIAKQIVEAYGGNISVSSKIDHGTTFTLTLPNK